MHYSSQRLTPSVAYVTTLTYASTNDQWARPALLLVSSSTAQTRCPQSTHIGLRVGLLTRPATRFHKRYKLLLPLDLPPRRVQTLETKNYSRGSGQRTI